MNNERFIRDELIFHLFKGNAHMAFEEAVEDFPTSKINTLFTNNNYTFWHLLEHIRLTQFDILDFTINSKYEEREWPKDYWPEKKKIATKKDWSETIKSFIKDRNHLKKLLEDPKTDLFKKIPWGSGQTLFREICVVFDHNAYHIGEFAIMRQVLGAWQKDHK